MGSVNCCQLTAQLRVTDVSSADRPEQKKKSFNNRYSDFNQLPKETKEQEEDEEFFHGKQQEEKGQCKEDENQAAAIFAQGDSLPIIRRISKENIRSVYKMGQIIGSGNFGTVRLAAPLSNPHKTFAVKSIPRDKIESDLQMLEQELLVLMEVDHPNIIKFYETYRDKKYYHIVMEYCDGGELFEHLISIGKFSEADAARIVKQILSAIKHLHDKNIAHRDLKPENVIFEKQTKEQSSINIKLIDFGLSKLQAHQLMGTKLGTPYYVSPEVLEGNYDKRCDLWAVGVIAYILLSGVPPFSGKTEIEVFNKIRSCNYEFHDSHFKGVSEEAKDFIFKLLQPDPDMRLSADNGLKHKWMQCSNDQTEVHLEVMNRLRSFRYTKRLQQQLLLLLVNQLDQNDLLKNKSTFKAIDVDYSGIISFDELKTAFASVDANFYSDEQVHQIMTKLDYDKNGEINYSEFLSGTIDGIHLSDENLWQLFKFLDVLNNNYLTKESFMKTFKRASRDFTEEEVEEMLREMGLDPNEKINFQMFVSMIKNLPSV